MAITPWFTLSKTEVCCFNVKKIYIYIYKKLCRNVYISWRFLGHACSENPTRSKEKIKRALRVLQSSMSMVEYRSHSLQNIWNLEYLGYNSYGYDEFVENYEIFLRLYINRLVNLKQSSCEGQEVDYLCYFKVLSPTMSSSSYSYTLRSSPVKLTSITLCSGS